MKIFRAKWDGWSDFPTIPGLNEERDSIISVLEEWDSGYKQYKHELCTLHAMSYNSQQNCITFSAKGGIYIGLGKRVIGGFDGHISMLGVVDVLELQMVGQKYGSRTQISSLQCVRGDAKIDFVAYQNFLGRRTNLIFEHKSDSRPYFYLDDNNIYVADEYGRHVVTDVFHLANVDVQATILANKDVKKILFFEEEVLDQL